MPIYTVRWTEKMSRWSKIEADSPEEALWIVKEGRQRDVDSDPVGKPSGYKVEEGENGAGVITSKEVK